MWRFAVVKTRDNKEAIVRWCESKDEAMQSGAKYFSELPKGEGIISVEEIELNDEVQFISGSRMIHYVWC